MKPGTSIRKRLSLRFVLLSAALTILSVAAGGAPNAFAADHVQWSGFDGILDADRSLSIDLVGHPALLQSASFLSTHQALAEYFKLHPDVRTALVADPRLLTARERRFLAAGVGDADNAGNRVKRTSIDWFDSYLEAHADFVRSLREDPTLIDSPGTLSSHPEIVKLLSQDPAFAHSFKLHPGAYLNRG